MFSAPTLQTRSVMNKQNKRYLQLTEQLRYQISALLKTGMTNKVIAAQTGLNSRNKCNSLVSKLPHPHKSTQSAGSGREI